MCIYFKPMKIQTEVQNRIQKFCLSILAFIVGGLNLCKGNLMVKDDGILIILAKPFDFYVKRYDNQSAIVLSLSDKV